MNAVRWGGKARRRLIGVKGAAGGEREKDDFYETPEHAVADLLRAERFDGPIWEPACGRGAISRVLQVTGHEVVSTDLVDRGYGTPRVDFLMEWSLLAPNVVTNPPFKLAVPFVRHALDLGAVKVAMLCKLAFLEGQERADLFRQHPPIRVWTFSRRVACVRGGGTLGAKVGGGMLCFAWFVWERGHTGPHYTGGWL